jgi:glycosyl transferase family 25
MYIFVINLPEEGFRRAAIEKQLHLFNMDFEIFPAVKGKNISVEEKSRHYNDKWFTRYEGRSATLGELGCALSHIEIYKKIKEKNISHALILEDDAWLNPNLPELLNAIDKKYSSEQKNVFLFTWFSAISQLNIQTLWSNYHVAKVKVAYCAHGYVVSNAAAGALINVLYPVCHVADCWGWLRRHQIVNIFAVFPTCITADLSYETGTTAELKLMVKKPLTEIISHKCYRGFWTAYDHLRALKNYLGKKI